ncbi:hypothetical protein DYB28_011552, partial [Aphanomyces astaci]
MLGTRELRKGETSFFLQPGESLEGERGIQNVCLLAHDEAVLVQANERFVDETTADVREAGVKWMVYGPCEYIPPISCVYIVVGIYVRDTKSGNVRAVTGATYMLQPTEELWAKHMGDEIEELLQMDSYVDDTAPLSAAAMSRDPTRVVTFEVPHNTAIQVYDYSSTMSRIMFGPTLVMLNPEEQFTVIKLSGNVPKTPKAIKTLCLQLGPDFMRDQVYVYLDCRDADGLVRQILILAQIIRTSIFGVDDAASGKLKAQLVFPANNLCITNVDIQSAEPVDAQTRDSLQKSVQLAIEITTKSQEAKAKAIAMKEDEEAKGLLVTQQLENQTNAEKARKQLVELSAQCAAVEAEGVAVAQAKAK